ncbi:hypothetical protein C8J57DRAFT_1274799 [Mycena rebaudengoi]|nr:hypothetical protein C8J57DRAFT_1274799 [Mycena rebaudengoi]
MWACCMVAVLFGCCTYYVHDTAFCRHSPYSAHWVYVGSPRLRLGRSLERRIRLPATTQAICPLHIAVPYPACCRPPLAVPPNPRVLRQYNVRSAAKHLLHSRVFISI